MAPLAKGECMSMSDYMRALRAKVGNQLLELPAVSILTFDSEDRVLLVKHANDGLWTTPGGAVEPQEVPANAAVREMWEETGLHVELIRVLGVYGGVEFSTTYTNGDAVSFATTVFEARRLAGEPRPDGIETLEVAFYSRAELAGIELQPWAPRVLANAFAHRTRAYFDPPTWSPFGK